MLGDEKWWKRYMGTVKDLNSGFESMHRVLRMLMLQKKKNATKRDGTPIIPLPEKE